MVPLTWEQLDQKEFAFLISTENMLSYARQVRCVCFVMFSAVLFFYHQLIKLVHFQNFQTTQMTNGFVGIFGVYLRLL
jgi:hypothetical protein